MEWQSWSQFWSMGGRGAYVWSAYGITLIAVVAELLALRQRSMHARRNAALSRDDDVIEARRHD